MTPLQGKTAVITGASRPRGMGRATAIKLAAQGAHVVVTDLIPQGGDASALQETLCDVEARGVRGLAMAMDVTSDAHAVHA